MTSAPNGLPPVLNRRDLRALFGVNRQRVSQLVNGPGFPEPLTGGVWRTSSIIRWAEKRGRTLYPGDVGADVD
jgi:hypothetical protein